MKIANWNSQFQIFQFLIFNFQFCYGIRLLIVGLESPRDKGVTMKRTGLLLTFCTLAITTIALAQPVAGWLLPRLGTGSLARLGGALASSVVTMRASASMRAGRMRA